MLITKVVYTKDGASFAVLKGEERSIEVWSVVNKEGCMMVHFSFCSSQPVAYGYRAKYTARLARGDRKTTQVLFGSFCLVEDFEQKLKEVHR